jgi:hypothetical protein
MHGVLQQTMISLSKTLLIVSGRLSVALSFGRLYGSFSSVNTRNHLLLIL